MSSMNVRIDPTDTDASLFIPQCCKAMIVFIHGSGSDRFSVRNRSLSQIFNNHGYGTMLIDLLSIKEKQEDIEFKNHRFNIDLLTERLIKITNWTFGFHLTKNFQIYYFSSSTGTAAAINSSIEFEDIRGLVSRGGRIDLVDKSILERVKVPSLFLLGENDPDVIGLTIRSLKRIPNSTIKKICIIPGASHYFEEEGKMEKVSELSTRWFETYSISMLERVKTEYSIMKFTAARIRNLHSQMHMKFRDRSAAGNILSQLLTQYTNKEDVILVGIARGGIVVAYRIAKNLCIEKFEPVICKRLRDIDNPEKTIGAMFQDGSIYLSKESENVSSEYLETEIKKRRAEVEHLKSLLRFERSNDIEDKIVIVVDDGSFTGSTLLLTLQWIKSQSPKKLVLAIPVLPKSVLYFLKMHTHEIKYISCPNRLSTVGNYYQNFLPIADDQLVKIIHSFCKS